MADLWSDRTSLAQLSRQEQLELILSVRSRRREQRQQIAAERKSSSAAAKTKSKKSPLAALSMEQLLKLVEAAGGNTAILGNSSGE